MITNKYFCINITKQKFCLKQHTYIMNLHFIYYINSLIINLFGYKNIIYFI